MPLDPHHIGQAITFASRRDPDQSYSKYVYIHSHNGQTVQSIAANRGRPDMVKEILALNRKVRITNGHYLRSAYQKLKPNQKIKLPGTLLQQDSLSVLCGDNRPVVKDGYANYETVNRPGRLGLNRFLGYNPAELEIEVQFEGYGIPGAGENIENDIRKLERMAGRGAYAGAADGAPAVIQLSTTDEQNRIIPVIPSNYQWTPANQSAPLYRISGISWKGGDALDHLGRRVRAGCTITVKQYTPLTLVHRSAAQRAKTKKQKAAKK